MPKRTDLSGFDRMRRKAHSLARRKVTYDEVLTPVFLHANTPWGSFDEMATAVGIEGIDDLERKSDQFDPPISRNTEYRSFAEMVEAAHREFARKGLGLR